MVRDAELGLGRARALCPSNTRERRSKRQAKRAVPLEVIGIAYFLLIVIAGGLLVMQPARVAQIGERIAARERELQSLKLRNEDLKRTVAYVESLEFVEKEARTTLGMVDPGEVKALPIPSVQQSSVLLAGSFDEPESGGILSLIGRIAQIFGVREATAKGTK